MTIANDIEFIIILHDTTRQDVTLLEELLQHLADIMTGGCFIHLDEFPGRKTYGYSDQL
ncbi:hypothetical protein Plhal304r1_c058g0144791 [Plasmopara halstedii]